MAYNSKRFVVVADHRKESTVLGDKWKKGVPIEVIPRAYEPIKRKIEKEFGGKATLRMAVNKAGPVVTDNGNFVLDADFGHIQNPKDLDDKLQKIPGVVETGLFVGMAEKAYIGLEDGNVAVLEANGNRSVIKS